MSQFFKKMWCSVHRFDLVSQQWEEMPLMLKKRVFGNLLVVNNQLYAVGGDVNDGGIQITRSIERFELTERRWVLVTGFKDDRRGFSAAAVGSHIYVFGGSASEETYNDTWDAFDTSTGSWRSDVCGLYGKMPMIEDWGQAVVFPHHDVRW